jgi:hypothetical protein
VNYVGIGGMRQYVLIGRLMDQKVLALRSGLIEKIGKRQGKSTIFGKK